MLIALLFQKKVMKRAHLDKKSLVVIMLNKSFDANQSVNYIVKQDAKRINQLAYLWIILLLSVILNRDL